MNANVQVQILCILMFLNWLDELVNFHDNYFVSHTHRTSEVLTKWTFAAYRALTFSSSYNKRDRCSECTTVSTSDGESTFQNSLTLSLRWISLFISAFWMDSCRTLCQLMFITTKHIVSSFPTTARVDKRTRMRQDQKSWWYKSTQRISECQRPL